MENKEFSLWKYIIPAYYNYKKLNRLNYYQQIRKRDNLSQQQLYEIQWKKLKELVNHCYKNIPYYSKLFKENDIHPEDIKTLKDYAKIPELTKDDIKNNFQTFIDPSIPESELCYDSTSGSTGVPLQIIRSKEDQEYGFALRYRSNEWAGWKYWDKSLWLVSDPRRITELKRLKGRLILWLLRRLVIDTKDITKESMFKWVDKIKEFKPKQVYGYSSLLAEFSQFLLDNNITINGIEGAYSTAEVLRKRETISRAFNAPVYDFYGASEIPCIGHECKKGNMHLAIDEVLVEFITLDSHSNIRKMLCTPLYLYGMPLLRYELNDCAIPTAKECDCGLPYPVIQLKVGRICDNLLSPTGKLVSAITLSWYIVNATKNIKQYQIIQETVSNITVKIVSEKQFREENENSIKELLLEMFNTDNINVKFEYLNDIPANDNGKYRPIISKVTKNFQKQHCQEEHTPFISTEYAN